MTSLAAKLALRPEVVGIGTSIANVATADGPEQLDTALDVLEKSVVDFRRSIEKVHERIHDFLRGMDDETGQDLRDALEALQECEISCFDMTVRLSDLVNESEGRKGVEHVRHGRFFGDVHNLVNALNRVYIPLIRRARLSAIVLVFCRSRERGIKGVELDAGFAEWFLAAPREKTETWQETAYLLAVPESADRLLHSIHTPSQDRTDQIPGLSV